MNAIIENLLTRRSTRAFLQKEIPDSLCPKRYGQADLEVYGSLQSGKNPAAGRTHRTKTWTKGL